MRTDPASGLAFRGSPMWLQRYVEDAPSALRQAGLSVLRWLFP
ncbi:hypothetical protein [Salipiger sp.]